MAATHQIQTALLTEHFRYTPLTLLDDIINTVNELVFRAINSIEEGLSQAPPEQLGFKLSPTQAASISSKDNRKDALFELKQNEMDNGIVQLESLLNATVDKDFDKFEIYTLRNILAVGHEEEARDLASWVQLEHYKHLDLVNAENAPTPEEVQLQRRKLQETMQLNAMLKAEEARNAAVLDQLAALVGTTKSEAGEPTGSPFAFLASSPHTAKSASSKPLTQNVHYALTQLPALRELVAQLKDSLHALPNARHTHEDDDSREAKRRRYLDSQSHRALQRKGIDAATAAKTAAITGRKVGRDELEGMEAVVQALGGAQTRRSRDEDEMEE
ncbi:hypothetical protein LTR36_003386 [Oleoguttula mirabilis]|uniref:Uncharacterized protein n=1 Tax=Oleoguttula mirabilis TaxID=1507867 RepID=A0AAV9JJ38_9PEZI|nr:hypothetical protein LTR36_003386 [Oleoguttula mirabilis]